jgi:hypothetical protein
MYVLLLSLWHAISIKRPEKSPDWGLHAESKHQALVLDEMLWREIHDMKIASSVLVFAFGKRLVNLKTISLDDNFDSGQLSCPIRSRIWI